MRTKADQPNRKLRDFERALDKIKLDGIKLFKFQGHSLLPLWDSVKKALYSTKFQFFLVAYGGHKQIFKYPVEIDIEQIKDVNEFRSIADSALAEFKIKLSHAKKRTYEYI
jgi:hypothetical protein